MISPYRENQATQQSEYVEIETDDAKITIDYLDEDNKASQLYMDFKGKPVCNRRYSEDYDSSDTKYGGYGSDDFKHWLKYSPNGERTIQNGNSLIYIPSHRLLKITADITKYTAKVIPKISS